MRCVFQSSFRNMTMGHFQASLSPLLRLFVEDVDAIAVLRLAFGSSYTRYASSFYHAIFPMSYFFIHPLAILSFIALLTATAPTIRHPKIPLFSPSSFVPRHHPGPLSRLNPISKCHFPTLAATQYSHYPIHPHDLTHRPNLSSILILQQTSETWAAATPHIATKTLFRPTAPSKPTLMPTANLRCPHPPTPKSVMSNQTPKWSTCALPTRCLSRRLR